jgi:hypothetical protein
MTDLIEKAIRTAVLSTNVVEVWHGVVQRIEVEEQGSDRAIRRVITLIGCNQPTDCKPDKYVRATPDSSKYGIGYIEQRGSASVEYEAWGAIVRQPIRIVVWYNAARLGLSTGCMDSSVALNLVSCLRNVRDINADCMTKSIGVEIQDVRVMPNSVGQIFFGLPYERNMSLYLHPYAFVGIDCNVVLHVPTGCLTPIQSPEIIDCV